MITLLRRVSQGYSAIFAVLCLVVLPGVLAVAQDVAPVYLGETVAVKFTQPLQDLAASLEHDPLAIFN